jgi:NTP pyrophosphatase (non-canonical NTP hydrolase)
MKLQDECVKAVHDLDSLKGWDHSSDTIFIHLIEEVGEIARQLYNQKNRKDNFNRENLKDEIADVFILLSKLAEIYDIDIETAVADKILATRKKYGLE